MKQQVEKVSDAPGNDSGARPPNKTGERGAATRNRPPERALQRPALPAPQLLLLQPPAWHARGAGGILDGVPFWGSQTPA